jgi:hypothetical protein
MKNLLNAVSVPAIVAALFSVSTTQAGPLVSTTVAAADTTLRIILVPVLTSLATQAGTMLTSGSRAEKQALALNALEDAAHYYQTGELTGILPQVLTKLRSIEPELSKLSDAELVDSIVAVAESL